MAGFYDANAVEKVAINLFYGWGYNFYRRENQLRADDLLVRQRISGILGELRQSVVQAEGGYRRQHLAPLTREQPRHDPAVLENARTLEALARQIGALEGEIRSQPVPEEDHMTQRHRQEGETLAKLLAADQAIVGHAELLRQTLQAQTLQGKPAEWLLGHGAEIAHGLAAIQAALSERRAQLSI
ncbi:MAG TPA: hypothetical protein VL574_14845 [Stellaceae bacterium]|jgi:hypothetical protein|nr:hypothetical protein [Stellaceae bacterium]